MSNVASSEQLYVRKGAGYDEVYPLGQDNLDTSYDEKVSSANSPSMEEDDGLDVDGSEGHLNDEEDIGSAEPPIQFVIGPDGFRKFILLPLWSVNNFNSTIKKKHFDTLREIYQILLTSQSFCPSSLKSATTRMPKTSECMSRC